MDDLLDAAPCGYVAFTDAGTVTAVNATLAEMLGYDRAEIVGEHVERLLTVAGREYVVISDVNSGLYVLDAPWAAMERRPRPAARSNARMRPGR